ncbi:MAG: glycosyltransferase family 39 protein [Armatimonadetes bacterium]|nr:glycosyltransferase family 39 protein [Armatimonadota bacterium]
MGRPSSPERLPTKPPLPPAERAWRLALALVVAAALAVRLWGVTWSLPAGERLLTYHPDEGVNLVSGVLQEGRLRPHLDLGFYNYGTLYFYVWQAAAAVNSAYGLVSWPAPPAAPSTDGAGALILVGRLVSVGSAALTVLLCGLTGRRLHGRRGGLVAAAVVAAAPLSIIHSRFATVDAFATLLTTAAIWASVRARREGRVGLWMAVAGGLAGLAGAARYNAVLALAAPLVAAFCLQVPWRRRAKYALMAAAACVLLFLLACPGVFLNWPRFSADLLFEMRKSRTGMGLLFAQTGNGWWYHLVTSLRLAVGWPLLAAGLAGWALTARRGLSEAAPVAAFALVTYALIGAAAVRFWRYVMPLLPALAIGASALIACRGGMGRWFRAPALAAALVAAGLAYAAWLSLAYTKLMVTADPRDQAAAAIGAAGPEITVAFATTPWYWSPPLAPEFGLPSSGVSRRRAILASEAGARLRLPAENTEWDQSALNPPPTVVAVGDLESQDALRLRVASAVAFMAALRPRRAQAFEGRAEALGLRLRKEPTLPNDLLYIWPRVTLYWTR